MGGGHRWSLVTADLGTLLTALYVLLDDHVIPSGQRQWAEAIFETVKDQLALEPHGGRTPAGV